MAEQPGRVRGLFRRQRAADPSRSDGPRRAVGRQTGEGTSRPAIASPNWDAEEDLWDDEVWPDPAPRKRGARSSAEMFEHSRPPRTSPWEDDEAGWEAAETPSAAPLAPADEHPAEVPAPTRFDSIADTNDAVAAPALFDLNDVLAEDEAADGNWEPVVAVPPVPPPPTTADGPSIAPAPAAPTMRPGAFPDTPATQTPAGGGDIGRAASQPLTAPPSDTPPTPAAPRQTSSSGGLPSWTGYAAAGSAWPTAPAGSPPEAGAVGAFAQGQGEEPLAGEDRQSADTPDAGTPPPTLLTGTAEGSGPFADGAYLTPEELADPDAWDADDEELSLAGTAAAAEMVDPQGSDESAWDDDWDDEAARQDRSMSEFASDNDASDNDASDDDEATLDEDYNDDESSPVTVAAASAQLPRGTLVATSSWASIVTTAGLCLAVVAGIWQLLALAAGASSHLSGGHYDLFHRIGSGLTATGPTQALVLLVASVLVSIPSFLGDRNARAFDDAAATALGVCGASALVAAVGAVLTFRYGAHVADLTTGDLSTTQLLRLLTDLMATAGIALSAFATTVMALRTRR